MAAPGSDPRDVPQEAALNDDIRPVIALPRGDLPLPLLIALALVLGLALFLVLNGHRHSGEDGFGKRGQWQTQPPPPPLAIPPAPPPPVPVVRAPAPPPPPPPPVIQPIIARPIPPMVMEEPPPQPRQRRQPEAEAPHATGAALVVDLTSGTGVPSAAAAEAASDSDAARATLIRNRQSLIPQGAIIAAVLETPLNSDRPGLARALISQDARSFDGSRVLIPRGSRLIGEFKADGSPSQRRILVTWSRMIRPDGVAIRIGSPSGDALGQAGIAGHVNTHFFERFTSAVLQSALTIGTNLASTLPAGGNPIYVGLPGQASQLGQQLVPNTAKPPTIKVREGAGISVFVARDLDFGGTPPVR